MSHSALIGVSHKQQAPDNSPSLPVFTESLSWTQRHPLGLALVAAAALAVAGLLGLALGGAQ